MSDKSLLELLRESQPRLPEPGSQPLRAYLAPILDRLQGPWPLQDADEVTERVFAVCRLLYGAARSADGLALARTLLDQLEFAEKRPLARRTLVMCGLLAADTSDIAGAMEYYVRALRQATRENNRLETGAVWNNIGLATALTGQHDMAARCYERALAAVSGEPSPTYGHFVSWTNLADCSFKLGTLEEGLRYGQQALDGMIPAVRDRDPHAVILLHRNMVRLLVACGRVEQAHAHVHEAVALAGQAQSPRSRIVAATTQAAYEIACGQADVGLTRLEQALERARQVPAALRDTLACVIRAEEAVGDPARALLRLNELSRHIYTHSIERARDYVEMVGVTDGLGRSTEHRRAQDKARLVARLPPPSQPEGWKTLQRLAVSAAMRADATGWHGMRVGALTKALALAYGLSPLEALEIGLAAELHDIGMMSVPQEMLLKKGPLNEAERAIVRRHADAGDEVLRGDRHPRMLLAREIARYHHAHWDGSGYPERVGGAFIPLAARLCAVADAYDMMVCGYGSTVARTMDEALAELRRQAGRQFDPEIVSCFDALLRRELEDRGMDLASDPGMEAFQELILSLTENRGFV